ncbi:MAG: glycosyltransferase, partial [Leptospirillum sp. Group II 'C75']
LLVMISMALAGRYFSWRIAQTIYGSPLDWVASVMLVLVEAYAAVMTFLGFFVMVSPVRRTSPPLPKEEKECPTVDVMIPVYNEPVDVIRPTIFAASQLEYPLSRLRVWILDDGRRKEIEALSGELGVGYLTRPDNKGAKAGNLNHALGKTDGDLIAIFDCDHVPLPRFLQKTAGFFLNRPDLALVQTPHHFYSRDPFERNIGFGNQVPGEPDLFYHVIQPGMDLWNAAYFCGSAAVLRRSALKEIGGFRTETVTEDAHTSLCLHDRGYRSYYLEEALVTGLSPDSMRDLIKQRVRWCRGMIQIFRIDNPLFKKGLSFPQKLCYMNAIFYWFFSIPRLFFLVAPLLYIYFRIYSVHAGLEDMLLYLLPYLLVAQGSSLFFYRSRRSLLWSIVYEIPLSFYLIFPAFTALLFPKKGTFHVTPKGTRTDSDRLDFPVARPAILLFALNVGGLVLGVQQFLSRPGGHSMLLMNLFWTGFNTLLIGMSLGAMIERRQVRRHPRISVSSAVAFSYEEETVCRVLFGRCRDISLGGVRVQVTGGDRSLASVLNDHPGRLSFFGNHMSASLPVTAIRPKPEEGKLFFSARFCDMTREEEGVLVRLVFGLAVSEEDLGRQGEKRSFTLKKDFWQKSLLQIERFLDSI